MGGHILTSKPLSAQGAAPAKSGGKVAVSRPAPSITPVRSARWSEEVRVEMDLLWRTMTIVDRPRFDWYVSRALNARNYYAKLGDSLKGIPWWFIACIHAMEASFSFEAHLHNGDPLTRRTRNVPAGRPASGEPPFTWWASAVDALTMPGKAFDKIDDWSIAHALWLLESFNGHGYRLLRSGRIHSPYLWAGTSHYTRGKFVRDRVYDASAISKQAGCAGLIKLLMEEGR